MAKEPPVVGLGEINDEKNRRWNQCVNFLRNNPKLLLQMIPDPSDDEDDSKHVIAVGRPRPRPKRGFNRPLKSSQQRPDARNKLLRN